MGSVCELIGIDNGNEKLVNFQVELLKEMTETDYQRDVLTKLAAVEENCLIDTHASNKAAKALAVSLVDKDDHICFSALPDSVCAVHGTIIEVKSRVKSSKKRFTDSVTGDVVPASEATNISDSNTTVTCDVADGVTASESDVAGVVVALEATKISDSNTTGSCDISDVFVAFEDSDSDSSTPVSPTDVEINLFQQCLERILEQAQFRAYLSKIIVLASTGHISWCFYYTQSFDEKSLKHLQIIPIASADVDTVYTGILRAVQKDGSSFYLTKHGPIIMNALSHICSTSLHEVRVHVAAVSHSTVYYITVPGRGLKYVEKNTKTYALKVMLDTDRFKKESQMLRKIKDKWTISERNFYFIGDYDATTNKLVIDDAFKGQQCSWDANFCWTGLKNKTDVGNLSAGGVLIMHPANRTCLKGAIESETVEGKIFSELFDSLQQAHKMHILQCDSRPSNCMEFQDGWQVIDYDMAIGMQDVVDTPFYDLGGELSTVMGCSQYSNSGFSIKNKYPSSEYEIGAQLTVDWTVADDIKMLQMSCTKQHGV